VIFNQQKNARTHEPSEFEHEVRESDPKFDQSILLRNNSFGMEGWEHPERKPMIGRIELRVAFAYFVFKFRLLVGF